MGNILSAIHDDLGEYQDLCRKYGEEVQIKPDAYGNRMPDCYGKHAAELKRRQSAEWAAAHAARKNASASVSVKPAPSTCPWDDWRPSKDIV